MTSLKTRLLGCSAGLLCAAIGLGAQAEEAGEGGSVMILDTISVTAQKRSETAQDVPVSMDVRTDKDLQQRHLTDTKEVISSSPNAQMGGGNSGAAYTPYVAIRGVGSSEIDSDPSVGMFVDGVPMTDAQSYTSGLLDVERVEIMRGPQGTLYGRNTLGGSINMITRKPDASQTEGRLQVDVGNFGQTRTEMMVNTPINQGESAVRAAIAVDDHPGYTENDNPAGKDSNSHENYHGRLGVMTTLGDRTTVLLSTEGQRQKLRDGGTMTKSDFDAGRDSINIENDFHGELQSIGGRAEVNHELGSGATVTSITALRRQDTEYEGRTSPASYFSSVATQMAGIGVTGYTHRANNTFDADFTQVSQELRLASPDQGPFKYVFGLYGDASRGQREYSATNTWATNATLTGTGVTLAMNGTTDSRSLATFADGSYALTDRWEVFGGMRLGYDSKDFKYRMTHDNASYVGMMFTGANTLLSTYEGSQDSTYATPRAGVKYHLDTDNNVYASVSQGYKSGGFNASMLFANAVASAQYKSEHLTNYELGMKNSLLGGHLSLESALFYIDWENQQVLSYDATTGATPIVNAPRSRSLGGEMSVRANLGGGWHLGGGIGYADATYVDFKGAPKTGGGGSFDASGKQQQYHSKLTGNAELGYGWDIGIADLKGSAVAGYKYRSKQYFDIQNTMAQDGFGTVDARIGAENDSYGLYLWGRNLTDERYMASAVNYGYGALVTQGEPLTFGTTGIVKF